MRLRLLALCISTLLLSTATYAQGPQASQSFSQTEALQSDVSAEALPRFYAESRQILVEAKVWNPPAANGKPDRSVIPKESLERLGGVEGLPNYPTPAKGLTSADFRVLENGIEQKINFFHETDYPAIDTTGQWDMHPVSGGTWGFLEAVDQLTTALGRPTGYVSWTHPTASYILGFTPSLLKPGECRTIGVLVERRTVDLNRGRYCNDKNADDIDGVLGAANVAARIQQLMSSPARQSVKTSVNAYTFWSSGVLQLMRQTRSAPESRVLPATDFTYVVEVHDAKAPATVQIAIEFDLPKRYWGGDECRKHHPNVRVAGVVYKPDDQVVAHFDKTYPCAGASTFLRSFFDEWSKHHLAIDNYIKPSRFDTQVELPPGDYELRVATSEGEHFGTAQLPLHLEGFNGAHLAISDVVSAGIARDSSWVLAEAASVTPFPVIPSPLVSKNLQFFPDIDPTLRRGTPLTLYFEIYEPALKAQPSSLFYEVRITDLKAGSLVLSSGLMSADKWLVAGNTVVPIGLKIDTAKLKKGSYRIEVRASEAPGQQTPWRQAIFRID